ncbi:MAG TPA: Slp family lipoprotein [Candidatus Competibacteraceae bacterium]|nr:Slp family lipoprotein [Candidatus Competibacteraceae bacterium]
MRRLPLATVLGVLVLLSAGCAQTPYNPITDRDFKGPTLARALSDEKALLGSRVRWGGAIAKVENEAKETWIEVVEHPLAEDGWPRAGSASSGRFLGRVVGFLDPAIYAPGRLWTVVGTLEASQQRNIGAYPYRYPVVAVEQHQLWPERRRPDVIYLRDPFYDPFYRPYWWYRPYYWRRR